MRRSRVGDGLAVLAAVVSLTLAACSGAGGETRQGGVPADSIVSAAVPVIPGAADTAHPTARGVVYVPVYSHIYDRNGKRYINLTATLSVRNTDPERPMTLTTVQYFNTAGKRVRVYQPHPVALAPLATAEFIVAEQDTTGGSGANFLVEWTADRSITEPVIEAVMISGSGTLGLSFVSVGRPLRRR
jgi:hypothetical protein